jgi:hypothetical protein
MIFKKLNRKNLLQIDRTQNGQTLIFSTKNGTLDLPLLFTFGTNCYLKNGLFHPSFYFTHSILLGGVEHFYSRPSL